MRLVSRITLRTLATVPCGFADDGDWCGSTGHGHDHIAVCCKTHSSAGDFQNRSIRGIADQRVGEMRGAWIGRTRTGHTHIRRAPPVILESGEQARASGLQRSGRHDG